MVEKVGHEVPSVVGLVFARVGLEMLEDIREVKHDVYGKRQTAKIILILLTFSLALK